MRTRGSKASVCRSQCSPHLRSNLTTSPWTLPRTGVNFKLRPKGYWIPMSGKGTMSVASVWLDMDVQYTHNRPRPTAQKKSAKNQVTKLEMVYAKFVAKENGKMHSPRNNAFRTMTKLTSSWLCLRLVFVSTYCGVCSGVWSRACKNQCQNLKWCTQNLLLKKTGKCIHAGINIF